jgi:SAM-dependent methyltransferase
MTTWDGDAYQRKFDQLAASGENVHGEVDLVMTYEPASVLDAGCGTGRVAIELANRGVDVVGADLAPDMLATARERAPHLSWVEADLTTLDLGDTFDVVVMAGNVMLFVADRAATVASCGRHLRGGGHLIAGFQVVELVTPSGHHRPGCDLASYDQWCAEAGLQLVDRFATWDRQPYEGGGYAVSVHRRAGADR